MKAKPVQFWDLPATDTLLWVPTIAMVCFNVVVRMVVTWTNVMVWRMRMEIMHTT